VRATLALTLSLSVGLTVSVTQPANAHVASRDRAVATINSALIGQGDRPSTSDDHDVVADGGEVRSGGAGRRLTLRLPGAAGSPVETAGLALGTSSGRGFRTAVQETGQGSFRALLYLESPRAQREYAFDLGPADRASLLPDGGVLVRDDRGTVLGTFAPPWATDASGASLETRYQVRGSTITQVIDVTERTRFPVVADPWWIPIIILARVMLGIMSKHAARQAAARGVSQHLVRQVIKNGKATRGNNNTTIFTQGSGRNRVRVVVDNKSGTVITVTKG
jgi:hypothetical protein